MGWKTPGDPKNCQESICLFFFTEATSLSSQAVKDGGFLRWGYPKNRWFIGKIPSINGWFRGTPIAGNPHITTTRIKWAKFDFKKRLYQCEITQEYPYQIHSCSFRSCPEIVVPPVIIQFHAINAMNHEFGWYRHGHGNPHVPQISPNFMIKTIGMLKIIPRMSQEGRNLHSYFPYGIANRNPILRISQALQGIS